VVQPQPQQQLVDTAQPQPQQQAVQPQPQQHRISNTSSKDKELSTYPLFFIF
jgi:hypothetical protein